MSRSSFSVALIGSSGGGSATLTSKAILEHLHKEFASIDDGVKVNLACWIFCSSEEGFDFAKDGTPASLLANTTYYNDRVDATLEQINRMAHIEDAQLAGLIRSGRIHALISISSDPEGVNKASTTAAIAREIPIVGTGGTSISSLSLSGANVIGSSGGSVATTTISKSICFATSLASYWNLSYKRRRPSLLSLKLQSILGAALPILLGVALFKLLLPIFMEIFDSSTKDNINIQSLLLSGVDCIIPTVITTITCSEVSGLGELSMISGAAAGAMYSVAGVLHNSDHLIILSITNGIICGYVLEALLIFCAKFSLLPTATTIIATSFSSIISGCISILLSTHALPYLMLSHPIMLVYAYCRNTVSLLMKSSLRRRLVGALLGYIISWGSEHGYYHSVMLPIIAFQMQAGELSAAGTFDLVCLCLPSAGVCLAVFLLASTNSYHLKDKENSAREDVDMLKQKKIGWKGFQSNFLFGDFVEACYPYTLDRPYSVLLVIRIACMVAGSELLDSSDHQNPGIIKSSAYSPFPFILWHIYTAYSIECFEAFVFASSVAFFLPFLATYTFHHRSFSEGNVIRERGREKVNNINNNEVTKKHARSVSVQGKAKAKSNKGKKSSSRSRSRTRTRTTHVL